MIGVHQLLPTVSPYDAIGNEVFVIQSILTKLGYDSKIYAENIHPDLKRKVKKLTEYKQNKEKNDIFIYHHSIGSNVFDFIESLDKKIIMIYHNITPPEFFEDINDEISELCHLGRTQLEKLKNKVEFAVAASEYSRIDLEKLGYKKTTVIPILLDMQKYKKQPDQDLISKYQNYTNILYVGRITPSKRIDEVIKIFHYYNSNINPDSNLFLLGMFDGLSDKYYLSLKLMIEKTGIKNVFFVTDANDKILVTYYSLADLFITMSNHEGFCVPLVENMFFRVPIIANNSSAIPYTLGNAGVLIKEETFEEVGELVDLILGDEKLKKEIIEKQTKRFSELYNKNNMDILDDLIRKVTKKTN